MANSQKYFLTYHATQDESDRLKRLASVTEADENSEVVRNALRLHEAMINDILDKHTFIFRDEGNRLAVYDPFTYKVEDQIRSIAHEFSYPRTSMERLQRLVITTQAKTNNRSVTADDVIGAALYSYEKLIGQAEKELEVFKRKDETSELILYLPFEAGSVPADASRQTPSVGGAGSPKHG